MDRPKITDTVRFWEEQDKINQAMIPRLLEMHEIVKKSSLLTQKNSSDVVSLSAKVKNLEARFNGFDPGGKAKFNLWNVISVALGVVAVAIALFK